MLLQVGRGVAAMPGACEDRTKGGFLRVCVTCHRDRACVTSSSDSIHVTALVWVKQRVRACSMRYGSILGNSRKLKARVVHACSMLACRTDWSPGWYCKGQESYMNALLRKLHALTMTRMNRQVPACDRRKHLFEPLVPLCFISTFMTSAFMGLHEWF